MIKQNLKRLKIINISLLIFLFVACSLQKKSDKTSKLISDYISEYSLVNSEKPVAVFISKTREGKITIQDVPRLASLSYLNENKYEVGMFSRVLCFYNFNELDPENKIFSKIPNRLKRKSKNKKEIIISGKKIIISNELTEWEPTLEIIYDTNKKKIINNFLKNTIDTVQIY